MKLSTKFIVIAIILTLVPLVVVGAIGFTLGRNGVRTHTALHLESVVALKQEAIADWVESQWTSVETHLYPAGSTRAAEALLLAPPSSGSYQQAAADVRRFFDAAVDRDSALQDLLLVDRSGEVRFSLTGLAREIALAGTEALEEGRRTRYVGVVANSTNQRPYIGLIEPALGVSGATTVALIDPDALRAFISSDPGLGPTGQTLLVVPGLGTLGPQDAAAGEVPTARLLAKMGTYPAPSGAEMVGRAAEVDRLPWTVVAAIPVSDAFADVGRMRLYIILSMTFLAAMSAAVAAMLSRSITQPLHLAVEGARAIGAGDLEARVPVASSDEIAELGAAFNQMAEKLDAARTSLERERQTLASIQGSMSEGLLALDGDGAIAYFNRAAEKLWWIARDKYVGRNIQAVLRENKAKFESPDDIERFLGALSDAPGDLSVDVVLARPKRTVLSVSVFGVQAGANERMTGILFRDVTDERDLAFRRDTFVSVASHELRTPITTIMGYAELLLTRKTPSEIQQQWLRTVHDSSQQISQIVDDLLDISRIQSGKVVLKPEPLMVREEVEKAIAELRPQYPDHLVQVDIPDGISAFADRDKLRQVLINLLSNAAKYSPEGSPIMVSAKEEADAQRAVIGVTDHGIGIAPADQERLFTAFYRIRRAETEKVRGTGLGLHIVKNLVELMGGDIWLASTLNVGSTFYFSLPVAATAATDVPVSRNGASAT